MLLNFDSSTDRRRDFHGKHDTKMLFLGSVPINIAGGGVIYVAS